MKLTVLRALCSLVMFQGLLGFPYFGKTFFLGKSSKKTPSSCFEVIHSAVLYFFFLIAEGFKCAFTNNIAVKHCI